MLQRQRKVTQMGVRQGGKETRREGTAEEARGAKEVVTTPREAVLRQGCGEKGIRVHAAGRGRKPEGGSRETMGRPAREPAGRRAGEGGQAARAGLDGGAGGCSGWRRQAGARRVGEARESAVMGCRGAPAREARVPQDPEGSGLSGTCRPGTGAGKAGAREANGTRLGRAPRTRRASHAAGRAQAARGG